MLRGCRDRAGGLRNYCCRTAAKEAPLGRVNTTLSPFHNPSLRCSILLSTYSTAALLTPYSMILLLTLSRWQAELFCFTSNEPAEKDCRSKVRYKGRQLFDRRVEKEPLSFFPLNIRSVSAFSLFFFPLVKKQSPNSFVLQPDVNNRLHVI